MRGNWPEVANATHTLVEGAFLDDGATSADEDVEVQDVVSRFALHALGRKPGERVAGVGGGAVAAFENRFLREKFWAARKQISHVFRDFSRPRTAFQEGE